MPFFFYKTPHSVMQAFQSRSPFCTPPRPVKQRPFNYAPLLAWEIQGKFDFWTKKSTLTILHPLAGKAAVLPAPANISVGGGGITNYVIRGSQQSNQPKKVTREINEVCPQKYKKKCPGEMIPIF